MEKSVNEEKLSKFYERIKDFPIVTFQVAKKMLNRDKSDETINEVFLGSLHAIYTYLASKEYASLDSASYDMDDIINTLVAEWFERIKTSDLERSTSYSNAIQGIIISPKFRESLGISKEESTEALSSEFLKRFLPKLITSDMPYTFEKYLSDVKEMGLSKSYEARKPYYHLVLAIEVLRNSDFRYTDTTFIRENIGLLMNYAFNYLNPPAQEEEADLEMERFMESKLDQVISEEIFSNPRLNEREMIVAKLIYGFEEGKPLTFDETAERLGIPKSSVQMNLRNFLTKTRKFVVAKHITR